ncbi:hypothetical protein M5D96_006707, partial [Drosophila gunungcola]
QIRIPFPFRGKKPINRRQRRRTSCETSGIVAPEKRSPRKIVCGGLCDIYNGLGSFSNI